MVAMKTCPNCGAEIPAIAYRCKECFHDFDVAKPTGNSPMALLVAAAAIALAAAGTFWLLSGHPTDERIFVDGPTRTVQWVRQYNDGSLSTDRLRFDDIDRLEYVITTTDQRIEAVTRTGDRKLIERHGSKSLQGRAEQYAEVMDRPLQVVDNSLGRLGN